MRNKIILIVWFTLTLFIYAWTEFTVVQNNSFEPSIAFTIYLCILTFPLGLIVPAFWMLIALLASGTKIGVMLENGHLNNFLLWISFVAVGYWQWFILLPKIIKKVKAKKEVSRLSKSGN